MENNNFYLKKIELVLSITNEEENFFTIRQREVINLLKTGHSPSQISQEMERCHSYSYEVIKRCAEKIEKIRSAEDAHIHIQHAKRVLRADGVAVRQNTCTRTHKAKNRIDYTKYNNFDTELLSRMEVKVLTIKINNPEITLKDLAAVVGCAPPNMLAQTARRGKKTGWRIHRHDELQK